MTAFVISEFGGKDIAACMSDHEDEPRILDDAAEVAASRIAQGFPGFGSTYRYDVLVDNRVIGAVRMQNGKRMQVIPGAEPYDMLRADWGKIGAAAPTLDEAVPKFRIPGVETRRQLESYLRNSGGRVDGPDGFVLYVPNDNEGT